MYNDYPLTKQQLGLWIEQKLHPSNTSYNTCVKVKLTGPLDEKKFRKATENVIDYFDTLKVFFVEKNGVPYQRIDQQAKYFPELIDISEGEEFESVEKERQAKQLLSDKLNTAIDLTKFPIMRASLIKSANEVYYFIGMVPHIVSDGRAAILYLESLSVAYNRGKQGLIETYGETKKNWDDYRKDGLFELDEETKITNQEHWKQRLDNANHYFDYSYGKKLIDADDKRGERVYFDLSSDISKKLKVHCKSNRTTLFNVFVCAFSIFIHKYYQLNDLLIGYPVNIRPPGYKHFFGFFVNILPVRVDMRGSPTYLELLKRVHQTRKEDKRYQKYPALDIVADIREELPDFDGRVFNLSMAQTVSRLFDLDLDGVQSRPLDTEYYDVNDDFSLSYELIEERIGLWFEYRKALFDRKFINQAMGHIERIIKQLLENPETRIDNFKLLSAKDQKKILSYSHRVPSNPKDISTSVQDGSSIHGLFELQVAKTPNEIAIVDGDVSLTYAELNQKANQLAADIQSKISDVQLAVAVSLEPGIEMITSLLAVLKTSCLYVPIPLEYPASRKQHILKDANVKLILANFDNGMKKGVDVEKKEWSFIRNSGVLFIDLSHQKDDCSNFAIDNPDIFFHPNDKCYIIYTSGSTGLPKGVVLRHSNVVPRLKWLRSYFNLDASDRMLQNTDFSFDVSVAEIFWPLLSGASLIIAKRKGNIDIEHLLRGVEKHKITVTCRVPSLLRALIVNDKRGELSCIKHVLSAGEALPDILKHEFYSNTSTSTATLYNFYGPTEAAIYSSYEKVSRKKEISVGIGRALDDTSLLVLDEKLRMVPLGVVGELYIGGGSIAEGYQSDDDSTNRAFIRHPFSDNCDARLYATGDYVRYDMDGRLEYVGRIDQQIKIRGFRVELGEIEAVISNCIGIVDLAVIDFPLDKHTTQLVAYLVRDNETNFDKSEIISSIKTAISTNLPHYMMPSIFSFVANIPRLTSGKLNRTALPNPQKSTTNINEFSLAETEIEKHLVRIWSGILSTPSSRISINESFFDLGGDSLMAIQFVSLAESEDLFFDIGDLFLLRTIRELSLVVKPNRSKTFVQDDVSGIFPLLPRQAKFFDDDFEAPNHWNRTFSFDLDHQLDIIAFHSAISAVVRHHDNLRVRFVKSNSGIWQQNCSSIGELDSLETAVARQYDLRDKDIVTQNSMMQDKINLLHEEINLQKAPLLRIAYFAISATKGKLAIIIHHLLLDMVSSRIIFEDLMLAYQSAKNNMAISLPNKTTSIKDWSVHLAKQSEQSEFTESLTYWSQMPKRAEPIIPLDFAIDASELRNVNREEYACTKTFVLPVEITQKLLKELPKLEAMPIQDFLLASFYEVIADWSNSTNITVSTCGHGREIESQQYDLSRTVGWVNTVYPVRLSMAENIQISELSNQDFLSSVRTQLALIPQKNIDYNILRYLSKHPDIIKHDNPDLFFNYVGQIDAIIPQGSPFTPAVDLPGMAAIAGQNHLCYLLYFEVGVVAGSLMFRVTYSNRVFSQETIDRLSSNLISVIQRRMG